MRHLGCYLMFMAALCFPWAARGFAAECPGIYGIHDHEPNPSEFLTHVKNAVGCGWVTATVAVGRNPFDQSGGDFTPISGQGHTVICRLNNGYGTEGTIPVPAEYDNFAQRCANYVSHSQGCNMWVIGNETNLNAEWPVDGGYRHYLSPQDYADCFRKCYNAIKAVRPNDKVITQGLATWGGPYGGGIVDGYPADGMPLNWVQYLNQMLTAVAASGPLDGIGLHIGSRGYTYADIHSTQQINAGGQNLYWSFYVYKDWVNLGIPSSLYSLPLYATECNGMYYWKGGHPEDPAKHYEAGWMQEMYAEINRYNQEAAATGKPIFRCVNLYRWCAYCDPWNIDGASDIYKAQIMSDLDAALAQHYTWPNPSPSVIVDNSDPGFSVLSGAWTTGTASTDKYGANYLFHSSGTGQNVVKWAPLLQQGGNYEVFVWYPQGGNRANNTPYIVYSLNGTQSITVNQQQNGGKWNSLGTFPFQVGLGYVTLSDNANPSVVLADAVKWEYRSALPSTGSITGFVRDTDGSPLSGAAVSTGWGGFAATSGADGSYTISNVTTGMYSVTAVKSGYTSQTQSNVSVGSGATSLNFSLPQIVIARIVSTSTAVQAVAQGQSAVAVQMAVRSEGTRDIRLIGSTLTFWQGSTDVSSHYTVIPSAGNTDLVPRGQSRTLNYLVTVSPSAPLGQTTIQGSVTAYENLVPNGSFEEDAGIPPNMWVNWSTGGSYALESSAAHGERSYRFNFANGANDKWVTSSTGTGAGLLPVSPGAAYHNRVRHKRGIQSGSAALVLVFEEYDASRNKIGGDHYYNLPAAGSFTESGQDYTTSPNAAYFRVWVGFQTQSDGVTGSAFFDDVSLYSNETFSDARADSPASWIVTGGLNAATIGDAKACQDGVMVTLTGKVVSANLGSRLWIQELGRSAAIRVDGSWPLAVAGKIVTVTGTLSKDLGERNLVGATVTVTGSGNAPSPVALKLADVCGPDLNNYTPGVTDSLARGLHTVGLFANVAGRVVVEPFSDFFYIDDGTGLNDGSGTQGLRILTSGVSPLPHKDDIVKITGLVRLYTLNSKYVRAVRCWSAGNIKKLN